MGTYEARLKTIEPRADKRPWFFDIYDRHLARYVGTSARLLEIGVQGGGGLRMWREYLGLDARITGIDIDEACMYADIGVGQTFYRGSQSDVDFLDRVCNEQGPFDIIIDDGSHNQSDLVASFGALYWTRMRIDGVYIVEDTQCCYWPKHEGGFGIPGTFIESIKSGVDAIHVPSRFRDITKSVCVYPWIVVFERGQLEIPT